MHKRSKHLLRRREALFAYLLLLLILLGSGIAAYAASRNVLDSEQRAFTDTVEYARPLVLHRLARYVDALQGIRALFDASMEVTKTEFQAYVDNIDLPARFPGLEAVAFSRRLSQAELSGNTVVNVSRNACGYPSAPTAAEHDYYIIDYVEPSLQRAHLSGSDAGADDACAAALKRALDSGRPAVTDPVTFTREGRSVPGFMVLVPVQGRGEANHAVVGVVIGYFVAPEVFAALLGWQARPLSEMHRAVYAGTERAPQQQLYASAEPSLPADYRPRLSAVVPFEFAGRPWHLVLHTLPEFHDNFNNRLPKWILGGGTLFGMAMFGAALMRARHLAERRRQAEALEHQATHDATTGTANRYLLERELSARLAGASARDRLTLYYIDLDGFKEVNNTLGHHVGDRLLYQIGHRLQHAMGPDDLLARMGGDEFAVLTPSPDSQYAAIELSKRYLEVIRGPLQVESISLRLDASIGIAMAPTHSRYAGLLMRRAEVAMYKAKRDKSGYGVYAPDQDPHNPQRLALLGGLRHAIERGEFFLLYQPKLELAGRRVTGVEALLRWRHPQRGILTPSEFIALAEQTAFIQPLTAWVIEHAARQARLWQDHGLKVPIAVNISAHNLVDAHLPTHIVNICHAHGIATDRLELEITESALIADPERAHAVLGRLRQHGLRIAIDDFGTGYSSLAYLKKLRASTLKVDASFVRDMASNEDDAAIVASTVQLAHSLGLQVVAEGIESEDVIRRLQDAGCDQGQGYFLCPPLTAEQVTVYLHRQMRAAVS